MNLIDMPTVVLMEIFEYLSYEEVSKNRLICRRIDQICQHVLNGGFNKAVRQHSISFKRIKALLPRRESERRNHCLARHADILTSIETRISMLSMTYVKYMDLSLCCFIPGRVLDEIFRILRLITKATRPLRPHEVLQELRDISSMAIEHFDEKIAATLKKSFTDSKAPNCAALDKRAFASGVKGVGNDVATSSSANADSCDALRIRLNSLWNEGSGTTLLSTLKQHAVSLLPSTSTSAARQSTDGSCSSGSGGCPEARSTMIYFKKLEMEYKKEIVKMHRMQQIQNQQTRRLQQALNAVSELNGQVIELKKRLEDVDAKNREISANINKQITTGDPTSSASAITPPLSEELLPASETNIPADENSAGSSENSKVTVKSTATRKRLRVDDATAEAVISASEQTQQDDLDNDDATTAPTCNKKTKI